MNAVDHWGLMKKCPLEVNQAVASSEWRRYPRRVGEKMFHCGYRCYLEHRDNIDKECTKDDPINECCYDESGLLATRGNLYGECRGTPDQYDQTKYPVRHGILDNGGIIKSGGPAFRACITTYVHGMMRIQIQFQ